MAILRNKTQGGYTVITNNIFSDARLSLKARGLLCTMLSLPDNWDFSEAGLNAILESDGICSIRSGLKELQNAGYLVRYQERDDDGAFKTFVWEVSNTPVCENPQLENPITGNPKSENHMQYITKESITKESNTKDMGRKRFSKPSVKEISAYCSERNNTVDPQRFYDYYESKGWLVGKAKMKDWKAAVRNWERSRFNDTKQTYKPSDESEWDF